MVRRVLLQGIVNAIGMVVVHVFSDQPVEMPFVQRDDRVEQLAPSTTDPALGDAVLPGGLDARARRVQAGGLHEPGDIAIKRRVVVEQHEAVRTIARKHVSQLLHHPRGRRLAGHVEMQNRAAMYSMTKKHESSWKVNVGTVKKSQATIASR